jgi:beta-glucosidase
MKRTARTALIATSMLLSPMMIAGTAMADSETSAQTSQSQPWMNPNQPVAQRVSELMSQMTLDDKIAMLHGSSGSYVGNIPANPRLGIPALNLQDGPAGVGDGLTGVTQLPAPIDISASWDTNDAYTYGTIEGNEQKGKGTNIALAPDVNIMRTPLGGRTFESFGEDPYLNGQMGVGVIRGIQNQGVIAEVKHFDANNQEYHRTTESSNIDERTLHEIYLPAFEAAVKQGHVGSVMAAYNKVNGTYSSENSYLIKDVLKGSWGFPGFVVSDWGATHSTVQAANNGLDMEMPDGTYFGDALKTAVQNGQVSMATIDDKVRRILTEMFQFGLFDHPQTGSPNAVVTSPQHAQIARDLAESGTVLLKNQNSALPLNNKQLKSIAVIGSDASTNPMSAGGGSSYVTPPYVVSPLQGITKRAGSGVNVQYAPGVLPNGELPDIPTQYLGQGLQGQFYNNVNLSGSPVLTRTDSNIDFNWNGNSPGQGVNADNWSAQWTGTLTPPTTGTYTFSLTSDDGSRLYINGQLVVDNWNYQAATTKTGTVTLTAGQPVTIKVQYMQGGGQSSLKLGWQPPSAETLLDQAVQTAKQSDVAIVFANDYESEGSDRTTMALPNGQDQLIEAVAKANPHTIVVLNTGGPVLMPWLNDVQGVVEAWYPGQEDGNAIASILFGDVNPSGHLPMTFPTSDQAIPTNTPAQYPGINDQVSYSEGLNVGYRWFDANNVKPLFPFGYGLSYTTFKYSNLNVTPQVVNGPSLANSQGQVKVSVDVTNTGSRAGYAVPQLYIGDPTNANEPPLQLKGFQKVLLNPGETKHVTFTLDQRAFSIWDSNAHNWTVLDGTYKIMIGSSSADIELQDRVQVQHTLGSRYVSVQAPSVIKPSSTNTMTTTVTNTGDFPLNALNVKLNLPDGWTAKETTTAPTDVQPHSSVKITWAVGVPAGTKAGSYSLSATATWNSDGGKASSTESASVTVPYTSFADAFNNIGISDNSNPAEANFDGSGYSFSAQALAAAGLTPGATITKENVQFTWPNAAPGSPDNVATNGQVVLMPGTGSELAFLGAGTNGTQSGQGTVTYTDGTTQSFNLTFADWWANQAVPGTELLVTTPWNFPQGAKYGPHQVSLYFASIPLDSSKTVAYVTLPNNGLLHVFAMSMK